MQLAVEKVNWKFNHPVCDLDTYTENFTMATMIAHFYTAYRELSNGASLNLIC